MLSRTADHLYWLARFIERAENTARMLDVNYRMSLLPQNDAQIQRIWGATLSINGLQDLYQTIYDQTTPENVLKFMVFDKQNGASIVECLRLARENAHAVRGTITSEMWETINSTWIELREQSPENIEQDGVTEFLEWVKYQSHLVRGVTLGTMPRDEAFRFVRLGGFLERADNTARILDVKYHILMPSAKDVGGAADYYQWGALLHSLAGFEAYRQVYRDLITPIRVAELLMLRDDMPRSLHYCMDQVYNGVQSLGSQHTWETERRAGELHAQLHFGSMEDIFQTGLHEYLTLFLKKINALAQRISNDFLLPSATNALVLE
ncbi:MAG: hypothetical protein RIT27_42 [Pseudomonadota bacterium]|jgi:uncharacterized alpha-E superfamily protein